MRSKWLKMSMMFVVVIALSAAVGACGGDGNECGPGTMEIGDQCVPFCADNEYWNGTECVGAAACAAGTVLNATTGECEPACADGTYWTGTACADVPTCGDGTQFNATTGECEPICTTGEYWDGTACAVLPACPVGYDLNETTGECEALCAPGTFWDTTTETCLDACGEGTVLSNGVCLPWIDVVESDSMEPAENNDAMMGGMPGMLTLPAMDASMVLEGIIDSPTDLDGDGYDDADYDTWYFSATQGTRLTIEGWADGVFNVATLLIGASEDESNWWYQRYGLTPDSPESERDFVIPMDGEYLLAVTDFSNLTGDFPVGGPEMGYFVNITQVANPAPIAGTVGTPQTGSVFDIDQVTYTGTAGELWDVTIDAMSADVYGIMPVFNASGDFLQELEGEVCEWYGCFDASLSAGLKFTMPVPADGGFMFTADYRYRSGLGGDYGFTAQPNPNVEVLDVSTTAVHNEDLVSSEGEIIYQIDVVAGNLYNIAFENLGVDMVDDLIATLHDVDFNYLRFVDTYNEAPWEFNIYAEVDARYFIRVFDYSADEAPSDYTYDLVVSSWPVEDLGTLDSTNTTITRAGAGPVAAAGDVFWFAATVDQTAEITGSFAPTVAWNLDFEIYDINVQMLDMFAEAGDGEAEIVAGIAPAGTYLFRAYESGMDAGDSTYTFDIDFTYNEVPQEVESNDDFSTANVMEGDAIIGLAEADGIDYFSYTVAGQGVLMFETGPGDANGDTVLWMYDTDGTTELAYNDDYDGYYSFVASEVDAGTYFAAVAPWGAETNYVLYAYFVEGACVPGNSYCEDGDNAMVCNDFENGYEAEACDFGCGDVDGVDQCMPPDFAEVEPNNDFAGANEIVLDFDGYGDLPEADYDYYTFTLASDAIVTAETYDIPGGVGDTVMYLYDASEAELVTNDDGGAGFYSLIAGQSLTAGTYFIMVRGFYSDFTGAYSTGYYGLTVVAEVVICTADATQCNTDGNLEICNAVGTAWDVTVCSDGCESDGGSGFMCALPANDDCAGAVEVTPSGVQVIMGDTSVMTDTIGQSAADAYYTFTLTAETDVDILMEATGFDTYLRLYSGACGSLVAEGTNDDCTGTRDSCLSVTLAAGTYVVVAEGYYSYSFGVFTLTITFPTPSLIISEYVEGTSNNKAIEFTNLTSADIELSNCEWVNYNNGNAIDDPSGAFVFAAGTLAPGASYVVCNTSGTVSGGGDIPDASCDATGNVYFNGNDSVVLYCGGEIIDVFGQVGLDEVWGDGTAYSTQNNTLRRNCGVILGDTIHDDVFDPSVEWTGAGVDAFGDLGVHCP
ncbi:MAG: DVUA0089 family protein [Deltaproteobacteria bacterium]|nr:DVUA0089 family protein [Deltaproteobacteria bacterium]